MVVKKFPVTSAKGNEYLIEIRESYFSRTSYEVRVYEQSVGWFGIKHKRFLNEYIMGSAKLYNITDFNYDLVEMAKYVVTKLEEKWEAEELLEKKKHEAVQKFEKWNGEC